MHPDPMFIQTIEYRIIPDQATLVAALESGETLMDGVPQSEIGRFQDPTKFTIFKSMGQTLYPALAFNLNKAPWNDLACSKSPQHRGKPPGDNRCPVPRKRVRRRMDLCLPVSPVITHRLKDYTIMTKRKPWHLFAQAGYTPDTTGKLVKDGTQLAFKVVSPSYDFVTAILQIVQQQLKDIGIDMQISTVDPSLLTSTVNDGEYDLVVTGYNYPNAGVLFYFFDSAMLGAGLNASVSDPGLDTLLNLAQTVMDPTQHTQYTDQIQMRVMESAYWITLVNSQGYFVVSTRVQDAVWSTALNTMDLSNAWLK